MPMAGTGYEKMGVTYLPVACCSVRAYSKYVLVGGGAVERTDGRFAQTPDRSLVFLARGARADTSRPGWRRRAVEQFSRNRLGYLMQPRLGGYASKRRGTRRARL